MVRKLLKYPMPTVIEVLVTNNRRNQTPHGLASTVANDLGVDIEVILEVWRLVEVVVATGETLLEFLEFLVEILCSALVAVSVPVP